MEDANDVVSAASKILESEAAKNLLSPVTKEIGGFLGMIANLARFYATENLSSIFTKWGKFYASGRSLDPENFKKVMPLLPLASMVSDDELQEKWAALLESTATQDDCLPSLGYTLSQLTAEEVRYLDRLWKVVTSPGDVLKATYKMGKMPLTFISLISHFDPNINTAINQAELQIFHGMFTEEQKANYERFQYARLILDDLIRLGIISQNQKVEPGRYVKFQNYEIPVDRSGTVLHSEFSFSEYGISFMKAVTTKPSDAAQSATAG